MPNPALKTDRLLARAKRALSQNGAPTIYGLGRGGTNPGAPRPQDAKGRCDCSGYAAWVLGVARLQRDKRKAWSLILPWIETTLVARDAQGGQRMFVRIPEPVEGCVVVYGDRLRTQGHVGIVVRNSGGALTTIDCSTARGSKAIALRPLAWWLEPRRGAVFCVLREDLQQ